MKTMRLWLWAAIAALALTGCTSTRIERYGGGSEPGHGGDNGGGTGNGGGTTVQLTLRTDWGVSYEGRTNYTEEDGSVSRVEEFTFRYTGSGYFILRTLTDEDFENLYGSDVKSLIEGECKDVRTIAGNQKVNIYDLVNVFDKKIKTFYPDVMIHGDYTAYLIEMDAKGNPTYNYCWSTFSITEERPTEAFLKWLGSWKIGDGTTFYEIQVSSCEANYLYYIDGWETGQNVSCQMNQDRDWLYARFRGGELEFYGQYLMSYNDTDLGTDVDQMFVGTYLTSTSDVNGEVDAEGADAGWSIASTRVADDGSVTLVPDAFDFENGFHAVYHSMRYSRFCYDENNWAHFNVSGVPSFAKGPMTLEILGQTKAEAVHPRTSAVVRRTQPKAHVAKPSLRAGR